MATQGYVGIIRDDRDPYQASYGVSLDELTYGDHRGMIGDPIVNCMAMVLGAPNF